MAKRKFLKSYINKWRKMGSKIACENCYQWAALWPSVERDQSESPSIPRDVPKGHLVVYVGEHYKRFVIKITLLKHPLFKALLDQARDVYDFSNESKLCIPCEESTFLDVIRCASSPVQHRRIFLCLN